MTYKRLDVDKKTARRLQELASLAHERALGKALDGLHAHFQRWKVGEIDAFALSQEVHVFHSEKARELYVFYTTVSPDMLVAHAIEHDLLSSSEVGEIPPVVERALAFLRADDS